jgi:hypothetical protein
MQSLVVYGPKGCGKTKNAARLAKHFGLSQIIDDWCEGQTIPAQGALVLTQSEPADVRLRMLPFSAAMLSVSRFSGS